MPDHLTYRSQMLDHLCLVAGLFDELGIGDVLDQATDQNPALRDLTVGEAVNAMGLNGLGCIKHALSLVPRFFQPTPTSRLIAPRVAPKQLNDDALGRALDALYASGVTALSSRIAATAVQRLGLAPHMVHLESPSFPVDGRYHSAEEPDEPVMHITRSDSREQRPDLTQVMLDWMVEPQAGLPGLMTPLSGTRSAAQDCGPLITDHRAQWQSTSGTTFLVADGAL